MPVFRPDHPAGNARENGLRRSQGGGQAAILDPELTLTQPPAVAAATGMDALSHAIETAVTLRVTRSRKCSPARHFVFACEDCVESSVDAVEHAAATGDVEARADVLLGAALAGMAIEHSMLGAAHAAANPLTARFGLVHGHAVGLMLPAVVRFNAQDPQAAPLYHQLAAGRTAG